MRSGSTSTLPAPERPTVAPDEPRRDSWRRRAAGWRWPIIAVVVLAAVVLSHYAVSEHFFQADEQFHVQVGRFVFGDGFPEALFHVDVYSRGLQRLYVWLIGPELALFSSPHDLEVAHVVSAACFALTAVPV